MLTIHCSLLTAIVIAIAKGFLGMPYVPHTLDRGDKEQLFVSERQFDCTTFVETVTAKALCQEPNASFADTLRCLRYRSGKVSYMERLHYFSDWIAENQRAGRVTDVLESDTTVSIPLKNDVGFMSAYAQLYPQLKAHPEWVLPIKAQEQLLDRITVRHIPAARMGDKRLRQLIHDGDILALTATAAGLDIAHVGFALWKKDGLHLVHASQARHKVVIEPLEIKQYLMRHPKFAGVRVIRIITPKQR